MLLLGKNIPFQFQVKINQTKTKIRLKMPFGRLAVLPAATW